MCTILAKKSKLRNSNKESWFLYKNRDRAYDPVYTIKYNSKGDTQAVFLVDQDSDWTEGVNSAGIMLVSAALQNRFDKTDGTKEKSKSGVKKVSRNGVILRQVLRMDKIQDVVDTLVEERFTGNTFVSDGNKLFIVEIYIIKENIDNYTKEYMLDIETDELTDQEINKLVMKNLIPEDYSVSVKEIKEDILVVRTNHGLIDDKGGYQPYEDGYESSTKRFRSAYDALKKLPLEAHPFEALTVLKNLTIDSDLTDKKDEMSPVRGKGNDSGYFTGTIVMLTPTGSMFAVPLYASFENVDFNRIHKERKVHFVLLPKNLPLFESTFTAIAYNELVWKK